MPDTATTTTTTAAPDKPTNGEPTRSATTPRTTDDTESRPTGGTEIAAPTTAPADVPDTPQPDGPEQPSIGHRVSPPARRRARRGRSPDIPDIPDNAGTPDVTGSVITSSAASAHDRVWAALRHHPGSTAAALADTSGVARSTVAKFLAAWGEDGSATSAAGATARGARRWTAAPCELPAAAEPSPATTSSDTAPKGQRDAGDAAGIASPTTGNSAAVTGAIVRQDSAAAVRAPVAVAGSTNRSGTRRLPAGALQGMVQDYLGEHPGEHGPTAIGHALGRSSGAIANALKRLTADGWAELTNDRPLRYRNAERPDPNTTD